MPETMVRRIWGGFWCDVERRWWKLLLKRLTPGNTKGKDLDHRPFRIERWSPREKFYYMRMSLKVSWGGKTLRMGGASASSSMTVQKTAKDAGRKKTPKSAGQKETRKRNESAKPQRRYAWTSSKLQKFILYLYRRKYLPAYMRELRRYRIAEWRRHRVAFDTGVGLSECESEGIWRDQGW
jgi:hypothetical protein